MANDALIFLADDSLEDRDLVYRTFKAAGKQDALVIFPDGSDLLTALKQGEVPRAILLDMDMPTDGFEVLRFIESRGGDIPTFVLHTNDLHKKHLEDQGCRPTGFLQKGFDYADFCDVIIFHPTLTSTPDKKPTMPRAVTPLTREPNWTAEDARLFVESSYDGYWDWHLKENFEYMSPRFWEILGYHPEEKEHSPDAWQDLIDQHDLKVALANFDQHVQTRGAHPYFQEVRYRHKKGHWVTVLCRGQVVEWDQNGQPVRMIGTHTDISESKKYEDRLRVLAGQLPKNDSRTPIVHPQDMGALRPSGDGTATFEETLHTLALQARVLAGAHQGTISYLPHGDPARGLHTRSFSPKYREYSEYRDFPVTNPAWRMLLALDKPLVLSPEELREHPILKKLRPDMQHSKSNPPLRGLLVVPIKGPTNKVIGLIKLSDPFADSFTEQDVSFIEHFANFASLTFRLNHTREKLEERSGALERSNRELEEFAHVVSHDLQAPLRAIQGYGKVLQDKHGQGLGPDGLKNLEIVTRNARAMHEQIEGLLEYSSIGRQKLQREQVNLDAVVQEVVDELLTPNDRSKIVFDVHELGFGWVDRRRIKQVLHNILSNAIKFSAKEPEPHIEIGRDQSIFYFRDNGVGFNPKYMDKVFGIFERVHKQREFPGSGIGMSIAQKIVDQHGGKIWLESALGQGTTVFINLPDPRSERSLNEFN